MEALVLMGGFVYLGVLGFWIMGKIDRFIDKGGFAPDWDEEETQSAVNVSECRQTVPDGKAGQTDDTGKPSGGRDSHRKNAQSARSFL